MKLSHTASYAIHALVYVAGRTPGPPVTGNEAAKKLDIPQGFLLRLLVALARANILTGIKGPNGGYRLGRPAKKISLLDVIEAVEGPFHGRIGRVGNNPSIDKVLQSVVDSVTEQVREYFNKVKIADLARLDGKPRRSVRKQRSR